MKSLQCFGLAIFLGVAMLAAGCSSKTTSPAETSVANSETSKSPAGTEVAKRENALVRLVNARTDQVDVYFGDMKAFAQVEGQGVTPYSELPAERHELKLQTSGKDPAAAPIATNSEGLKEGVHYTAIAFKNKDGSAGITLLEDNLNQPADGKARIRVANFATGVDEVDVYPTGEKDTLVKGVNFNSATSYEEVNTTIKGLEVRTKGAKQAIRVPDLTLSPGKTYTIVVLNGPNALKVIPIEDSLLG